MKCGSLSRYEVNGILGEDAGLLMKTNIVSREKDADELHCYLE